MRLPIIMPRSHTRRYSHYLPSIIYILFVIVYSMDTFWFKGALGISRNIADLTSLSMLDFYGIMITLSTVTITLTVTIMTLTANLATNVEKYLNMIGDEKSLSRFREAKEDAYAISVWVIITMLAVLILSLIGYIVVLRTPIMLFIILFPLTIAITDFILSTQFVMGLVRVVMMNNEL